MLVPVFQARGKMVLKVLILLTKQSQNNIFRGGGGGEHPSSKGKCVWEHETFEKRIFVFYVNLSFLSFIEFHFTMFYHFFGEWKIWKEKI